MSRRPTWDELFMSIARLLATRSTCSKKEEGRGPPVGCVITVNNRIVSTGYNGSLPGQPHCDDVGHLMVDDHCVRTVHAEQNAIVNATKSLWSGTAYITRIPCQHCLRLLLAARIHRIVCGSAHKNPEVAVAFAWDQGGIILEHPGQVQAEGVTVLWSPP